MQRRILESGKLDKMALLIQLLELKNFPGVTKMKVKQYSE